MLQPGLWKFIKGTMVYQASEILNEPGGVGFGRLSLFVSASEEGQFLEDAAYDPSFMKTSLEFSRMISARMCHSCGKLNRF